MRRRFNVPPKASVMWLFVCAAVGALAGFAYEFGVSWYYAWYTVKYPAVFAGEMIDWGLTGTFWGGVAGIVIWMLILVFRKPAISKMAPAVGQEAQAGVWPPPPRLSAASHLEE